MKKVFLLFCAAFCAVCVRGADDGMNALPAEIRAWFRAVPADSQENLVFSPVGLMTSFSMLGHGTGGQARADISAALGISVDFGNSFNALFARYEEAARSNAVSITLAPSIWTRHWKKMDRDYIRDLQRDFQAETGTLESALPINAWTEAKTDGRIPEIVSDIPLSCEILLLNAVAFEGAWQTAFDPAETRDIRFQRDDGSTTDVKMMRGIQDVIEVSNACCRAISVPYAAEGFQMVYVLPHKGAPLAAFRDAMHAFPIADLKSAFRTGMGEGVRKVRLAVAVPRMELRSRWNLANLLASFNIPRRGYARIGTDFKVSDVMQSAWIRVTEKGYSLTPGVFPPEKKRAARKNRPLYAEDDDEEVAPAKPVGAFACNRPFVWFVWDSRSDTILLAGRFTGHARP